MTHAIHRLRRRVTASYGLALLAAAGLTVAGCGTSPTVHRSSAKHASAAAAAHPTAGMKALAARYLVIARPANHGLDVEVDGYGDAQRDDLARARADLVAEVATERHFDAQLLAIPFPGRIAGTVRALVRANLARIAFTEHQADAPSLARMRQLDHRHHAADAAVEAQVRLIRSWLGLPPPSSS